MFFSLSHDSRNHLSEKECPQLCEGPATIADLTIRPRGCSLYLGRSTPDASRGTIRNHRPVKTGLQCGYYRQRRR